MSRKNCSEGHKLDNLLNICRKVQMRPERHTERPVVVVGQLRASVASVGASSAMMLSPALWSCVVLATLGSILALGVWVFIYRRQRRHSSTSGASASEQESLPDPLDKQSPSGVPSHCPYQHTGSQAGSRWGGGGLAACTDPGGLLACSAEHRIPLPATELGGTALVTAKTM